MDRMIGSQERSMVGIAAHHGDHLRKRRSTARQANVSASFYAPVLNDHRPSTGDQRRFNLRSFAIERALVD